MKANSENECPPPFTRLTKGPTREFCPYGHLERAACDSNESGGFLGNGLQLLLLQSTGRRKSNFFPPPSRARSLTSERILATAGSMI